RAHGERRHRARHGRARPQPGGGEGGDPRRWRRRRQRRPGARGHPVPARAGPGQERRRHPHGPRLQPRGAGVRRPGRDPRRPGGQGCAIPHRGHRRHRRPAHDLVRGPLAERLHPHGEAPPAEALLQPVLMARRIVVLVAAVAATATACSSQASRLPLTRAAGADSTAEQRAPADAVSQPLGPLDQRLIPDVLVRLPAPLQSTQSAHLVGLVPPGRAVMLRTGKVTLVGPGGSNEVAVAGVDPAVFRRFTPKNTAEVTGVWDNIAKGYLALSYDTAKRVGVPLGAKVTVAGVPLEVGALADTGLPDVEAVVSNAVAARLGLPPPNGLVLSGGKDDPMPLVLDVRKSVAKDARVDLLRAPADRMSFFDV